MVLSFKGVAIFVNLNDFIKALKALKNVANFCLYVVYYTSYNSSINSKDNNIHIDVRIQSIHLNEEETITRNENNKNLDQALWEGV